jgi:Phage Tail Collar Domain
MSYTVPYSNNSKSPLVIPDATIDHSTSVFLVGANTSNYGLSVASNFLHLLENFAATTSPANPVEGQLWYDTTLPSNKKLKIFDGASWVPTNGVYQSTTSPINNKPGDIWVDTATSALSIWNGYSWILIGPAVSTGGKNGTYTTTLTDNTADKTLHSVIISYINDEIITIISKDNFTPTPTIIGFTELFPGLNVSTKVFNGINAQIKGTSYTTLNLTLSGETAPVSADSFLRSDTSGVIAGFLRIDSDSGVRIGNATQTVYLEKQLSNAVLSSRANGSSIGLSVVKNGVLNQILTVDGNNLRVGINTLTPQAALHVVGSAQITNKLTVYSTEQDAMVVAGGVQIANTLTVTKDVSISGKSSIRGVLTVGYVGSTGIGIMPAAANLWDLGSPTLPFKNIYANQIVNNTASLSFVSTGMMLQYAGSGALPDGWLLCDGTSYVRTDYPRLFGVIGTTYGTADAAHFSVPTVAGTPSYIIKY